MTQLVRSPGAYLMEPKDATKQVFIANLMPSRGSWLELEIDKKGIAYARIDRKRKLPITTLLRALPQEDPTTGFVLDTSTNEKILELFDNSVYIQNTLDKDTTTREEEALIEVFKKQRPGEPPTLDNARNLLKALFFDPKRYDLTKVGRYKLNQRLGVECRTTRACSRPRTSSRSCGGCSPCRRTSACPRTRRTTRRTPRSSTATRSAPSSTSTSTSATGACGRRAS